MKSYTDIEQSKKLAEILPIESADHHYVRKVTDSMGNPFDGKWSTPKYGNPNSSHANYMVMGFMEFEILPCWSLVALLDTLPSSTLDSSDDHHYMLRCMQRCSELYENPIDAVYEMGLKLNETNSLKGGKI